MVTVLEQIRPMSRAVVDPTAASQHMEIRQFVPENPADTPWLEHVWSVQWHLPHGVTHTQRTVPYPAFNLIADQTKGCALFGCSTGCFDYDLSGTGQVVGFRFRPAAQIAFWSSDAAQLTDGQLPADQVLPATASAALTRLTVKNISLERISDVLTALCQVAIPISTGAKNVAKMVQHIAELPRICRLDDLTGEFQLSERSIQRQFGQYLGISPKLVIDRFRMHEALGTMHSNQGAEFADLAARLDYFDQSHFTTAFRKMTGVSPGKYVSRNS